MKATLNDLFKSTARVIHLSHFHKGRLIWEVGNAVDEYKYRFSHIEGSGYFPKMPVILQSNGLPWDIGNAYLLGQLEKPSLSNMRTLTARATHLKYYLQYLEDTGQHFLDLPKLYYERAPQKFRVFMSQVLDNHDFSAESINNVLSTVAHFYKNIRYESLVTEESLENKPFTPIRKAIMITNRVGLVRSTQVITNDLRIKSSRHQNSPIGKLRDGGSLRPLTPEEQKIIFDGFRKNYASIELELMIRIALETGARQQTACTLSIGCIKEAYSELEATSSMTNVVINGGQRYKADTKGSRLNRLIFRRGLIYDLMAYIECERAENRRLHENSFYGDTDDNYVFLTRDGNPYYTAQREILDRQDPNAAWNIKAPMMVPKNGQSLRNELGRFITRIQKTELGFKVFTFHDLRATMGMNIVRSMRANGYPDSKIFDHVRQRLNHSNFKTTEGYLNFDSELSEFYDIQEAFGEMMCGYDYE
ncbi:tyrosine-type recombinase/integrase [Neptunomonas phycophila]|uniref:Tyrosine-type recombinase/integrase n=1 Tax=Neptunomonas phycophila TaxID=1572645 RepID=A0ABT9EZ37_9GAMM|nr:tyrosine-type recombinase/integrase [Neptunomonas phycophila]MDP2524306.1 tyrosine-type recombinase/integrase [Neptunomonas phycophila]